MELLSDVELEAMRATAKLAGLCRKICGDGPNANNDWTEFVIDIHHIQSRIMAQAASRAYPEKFRPLGGWPVPSGEVDG